MTLCLAALAPPSAIPPEGGGEGGAPGCRAGASSPAMTVAHASRTQSSRRPSSPYIPTYPAGTNLLGIAQRGRPLGGRDAQTQGTHGGDRWHDRGRTRYVGGSRHAGREEEEDGQADLQPERPKGG